MKIARKEYDNEKTILMFANVDFVGVPVTISDAGVVADADGKKLVKKGTIVTKDGAVATGADAYGVLFNTADVTYGPVAETVLVEGHVDASKLEAMPSEEIQTALKHVVFHNLA